MPRVSTAMLIAVLTCAPYPVIADEDSTYVGKPKSQQDIIREREQACQGLKGEARNECLANYVGPTREKPGGVWKRPPNPPRAQGRT